MSDLRIVFMGTPDFAVSTLKELVKNNFKVVGVVTVADKPAGRGRKLAISAVKKFALEKGLTILQPRNLKSEEFIQSLRELKADLQIVVAFRMLPEVVWKMPHLGTFNLHASLLPDYRGAAPIHWAIMNGETETGVTTFFIDEKIDTGVILLQEKISIGIDETVGELHNKLMILGSALVLKTVKMLEKGSFETVNQPDKTNKKAPKLFPENCTIDWSQSIDTIYNKIRGLNPFPVARTVLNNNESKLKVKLYDVKKLYEVHKLVPGTVIFSKKTLKVAVAGGYINILSLQLEGKKRMSSQSLLNGFQFADDARFI